MFFNETYLSFSYICDIISLPKGKATKNGGSKMDRFEMTDKLSQKAEVSYEEARRRLKPATGIC